MIALSKLGLISFSWRACRIFLSLLCVEKSVHLLNGVVLALELQSFEFACFQREKIRSKKQGAIRRR